MATNQQENMLKMVADLEIEMMSDMYKYIFKFYPPLKTYKHCSSLFKRFSRRGGEITTTRRSLICPKLDF